MSNKAPLILGNKLTRELALMLQAMVSSFVFDFATRQSIGGTSLNYFILQQLPVIGPGDFTNSEASFVIARAAEVVSTSTMMSTVLNRPQPAMWDRARRDLIRAELDATFFHKYGLPRKDVEYVMDTFTIVKRHDEATHGTFRTKHAILKIYDEMATCYAAGRPYVSPVDPPPGQVR